MNSEEKFMQMAINLANKAAGFTSPNPLVGAVLVKNNKIIGKGYHKKYGSNHAEVEAIQDARQKGKNVKYSTLYVTLEPCFHYGKTPPCSEKIVQEKIKKVVIGVKDPNPKTNGKGIKFLGKNNVEVVVDVLRDKCTELNEIFLYNIKTNLPFVSIKAAIALNGKIGEVSKRVQISSEKSIKFAHKLRQKYDAILVGSNTVITDNPQLNIRYIKNKKDPLRIIFDKNCVLNSSYKVFKYNNYLICVSNKKITKKYIANFNEENILSLDLKNGHFDIKEILKHLYKKDIASLLVEGGSRVFASFLEQKIPQKGYFITSPKFITGKKAISLLPEDFNKYFIFNLSKQKKSDNDIINEGHFKF